jgi:radical SAM superfamily enzyme YgiQ (UPF0313 family)
MKVAFVSGNRDQLPDAVIPLGILYVMAATAGRHESLLVDLCFEDRPLDALASRLGDFDPDVVAVGMRNIQNADYSGVGHSLDHYRDVVAGIRSVTCAPIVLGGSGFSVMPRELMRVLRPDYGISGEGERALPELLDAIAGGEGFDRIGNLHRFRGEELISTPPPRAFLDMDRLAKPDRTLADRRYYERFGIDSLQTKRGCPLRCDYCTYPIIEGRVGRARDPRRVAEEMEELFEQAPPPAHVFVVDSVFNLPKSHAKAVCREIIARRVGLPWTCYANPLGFDAELAELMAAAGCAGMEVGADSGSDEVLMRLRKGFDTGQIRRLHELAFAAGLRDCHTFILGTLGEELDDVKRTLDFVVDLDPYSVILMVWTDDAEAIDAELAARRRALREQIFELLRAHRDEFAWWSIPAIGVNYDPRLFGALRRRGLRGPLWQHLRRLRAAPRAHDA